MIHIFHLISAEKQLCCCCWFVRRKKRKTPEKPNLPSPPLESSLTTRSLLSRCFIYQSQGIGERQKLLRVVFKNDGIFNFIWRKRLPRKWLFFEMTEIFYRTIKAWNLTSLFTMGCILPSLLLLWFRAFSEQIGNTQGPEPLFGMNGRLWWEI